MAKRPVTVVLADDHPPILSYLRPFLEEQGYEVVGEEHDGRDALATIEETRPQIALLDLDMPGVVGTEIAARLRETTPETSVVLYTGMSGRPAFAAEAVAAGARGVVAKEAPLGDLVRALELVAAGRVYVDAVLGANAVAQADELPKVTNREREILLHLANGLRNEQIAETLFISPETVRTHVRRILRKLNASTRNQAVATAIRAGIIR